MIFMLVGGSIAEFFGRKRTLVIGQTTIVIGWIIIYFANCFQILLLGRFVVGAGIGVSQPSTTLQLSEIALIKMRGILSMMGYTLMNAGAVFTLIMGAYFPLNSLIIMAAMPSVFFISMSFFLPESPVWLMKKGLTELAKTSLLQLRGPKYKMNCELKELEDLVKTQDNANCTDKIKELKSRSNAIPFTIITTIVMVVVRI